MLTNALWNAQLTSTHPSTHSLGTHASIVRDRVDAPLRLAQQLDEQHHAWWQCPWHRDVLVCALCGCVCAFACCFLCSSCSWERNMSWLRRSTTVFSNFLPNQLRLTLAYVKHEADEENNIKTALHVSYASPGYVVCVCVCLCECACACVLVVVEVVRSCNSC